MKCWICGNPANSGEHRLKASDMRVLYKKVSQQRPLYLHTQERRNLRINSITRSSNLKFKAQLCHNCNTKLTAPYDRAWERLSKYLQNCSGLKKGRVVKISNIFPGCIKQEMLNVHLYFVKLFGCAIKEFNIPLDIAPFQQAILNGEAHPKVKIAVGANGSMATGSSDLQLVRSFNGKSVFATWFYVVGNIAVNIMYAEPTEQRLGLVGAWHPSTISKRLTLVGY